jgi:hypothetical protein
MIDLASKYDEIAVLKAERDTAKEYAEAYFDEAEAAKVERDKLRIFIEQLTDTEHHNPPVPLWIALKARALLEHKNDHGR